MIRSISFLSLVCLALVILINEQSLAQKSDLTKRITREISYLDEETAQLKKQEVTGVCAGSEYVGICDVMVGHNPEDWKCIRFACAIPQMWRKESYLGRIVDESTDGVSCGDNKICKDQVCQDLEPGQESRDLGGPKLQCIPDVDLAGA